MTTKFNPYKHEIKFLQAANSAVTYALDHPEKHCEFFVYRTIDAQVKKFQLIHMGINLQNGQLEIMYQVSADVCDVKCEDASEQDLKLISARAKQLHNAAVAARQTVKP